MAFTNPLTGSSSSRSGGGGFSNPFSGVTYGAGGGDDDDSILDTIAHVFSQGAADLRDVALGLPAGLYETAKIAGAAATGDFDPAIEMGKAFGHQIVEDIRHPLRHPGYTLLDLLPIASGGAGVGVRLAAATRAARVGESASRALLTNPARTARVIKGPTGATATGHYSRAGLGQASQMLSDALLQGAKQGSRRETLLNKRINKWNERKARVEEALLNAASSKLWEAGKGLTNEESRALRFVAEKVPLQRRLQADQTRLDDARARVGQKPGTDPRTVRRLEERQQWGVDAARDYLDTDAEGLPVFKPEAERLKAIYGLMEQVVGEREGILKSLDLMDEARLGGAKQKAGRYAAGATYVEPTAAKLGKTPRLKAAESSLKRLEKQYDRLVAKRAGRPDYYVRNRARTQAEAITHLAELTKTRNKALREIANGMFGPIDKREVAFRNAERGKLKRQHARTQKSLKKRGFGLTKLDLPPTVWEERLSAAERKIQDALERNPDHPVTKRWAERDAEIDQLTEALSPDPDVIFGGKAAATPDYGTVATKVKRGPSKKLTQLEGAVALARKERQRAQEIADRRKEDVGIVGAEDIEVPEDALFIGSPKQVRRAPGQARVSSSGTYGHTRDPSFRESKGETVRYGMDEPNVARILASRGRSASKLAMLAKRIDRARKGGTKAPTRKDDVFLWTDDAIVSNKLIPPEVKEYLNDPEAMAAADDATDTGFMDAARQKMMRWAQNDDWNLDSLNRQALIEAAERGEGVFVQRSLLGDLGKAGPVRVPLAKTADMVNNAQKSALIYLKANYPIIQAMSNFGMNVIQQGFATPRNIVRTGTYWRKHRDLSNSIGDIMGTGALMTLAFEGSGKTARATQGLAHYMSHWVDGPARLSAFLHEADRAGFKTPEQVKSLLEDDANAETLGQVAQRAKESIVDYGEMGDAEKNVIRRLFFVYPWLKGSTKYTSHFLRDHPIQAGVLSQLGVIGEDVSRSQFPDLPSYLRGAFRGPGGGLINPSGVNQFQTPVSIASALAGLLNRTPESPAGAQFLTPFFGTAYSLLSGKDTLGRPLPAGAPQTLRQLLVEPAPLVQAIRAGAQWGVGDQAVLNALLGDAKGSVSFPDPRDPIWRFLGGGLYPRPYSEEGLARVAGLEQSGR